MNTITLELDGAGVEMRNPRRDCSGSVVFEFATILNSVAEARIPARQCVLSSTDLNRMAAYVRSHVGENAPHSIAASDTFVTYDLGFQLQGLSGALESWSDGYFTVRWMFYCGPDDRFLRALYVGIEARLEVAEALRWSDALDELAAATSEN